jgi:hypothetical protein
MSAVSCKGENGIVFPQFMELWTQSTFCWDYYYNLMFNTGGRPIYNPDTLKIIQSDFSTLFNNYLNAGYALTQPGDPKYNSFQEVLLQICNKYPGSCQTFLESWCPANTDATSMSSNTGLTNFCGCYVKNSSFDVSQKCQPLCHRVATVKLPDGLGGIQQCTDNVCVIDNVSITAAQNDSRSTNVSFTQVCRCPAGKCKCILSVPNFYGLVGNISFNQVCGDGSVCYTTSSNPNQAPVETTCPTVSKLPTTDVAQDFSAWIPWVVMIVIVAIIFLIMIL